MTAAGSDPSPLRPPAGRLLAGLALLGVVLHFATAGAYGIFRDELYYLACADHLAWGYVDHPPLSIAVLAAVRALLGESLFALRLVPTLAGGATVVVTGLLARQMGGGRLAQALAATAALCAPVVLANGTYYSMNALDLVLWPVALLLLLRAGADAGTGRAAWLWPGVVLGFAALNKLGAAFLGAGLAAGVALTPFRRALRSPWPWVGAAVAAAVVAPHVLWQIGHGWPFLEFAANARAGKMAEQSPLGFLAALALLGGPGAAPLWGAGLAGLLVGAPLRAARAVGVVALVALGAIIAAGGKPYYAAPLLPALFAAGAVLAERAGARRWVPIAALALTVASGVALLPLAVPLLPPERFVTYAEAIGVSPPRDERAAVGALPQHFADRFGWPELASAVAAVYHALPPEERARAAILASNYGEAGAIDHFGPPLGLPRAICPHNSYWLWGFGGATGEVVIAVGYPRDRLEQLFERVEERGRSISRWAMPYEADLPIHVCWRLRVPIDEAWAAARRFI